jgi:hypothetical protein
VLTDGWNRDTDGSEFYFIRNPALGLWEADRSNAANAR